MKKKILVCALILGITAGCGKVPMLKDGKEAIVSFDNEKLSLSTDDYYKEIKESGLGNLISMIDEAILLDKYPNEQENADKYVKEQIETVKKYYVDEDGKYDESELLNALNSYYGVSTIDEFKELLNLAYYRNLAVEDYAKESVTEKDIEKYYKEEIFGDIECSHILIKPEVKDGMTDEEKEKAENEALKIAKEVISKLKKGEDFAKLAKEYSADSTSKDGGKLGFFNKGTMVDEFWEASIKLKVNEYTKSPVKTTYGYHIILKTAEKDKKELKEVKDEILEKLAEEKLSSDSTMQINALADLRKSYGMNIEDSDLDKLYKNYISNQLISAQNNSSK